jgi:hypothetical protein
VLPITNISGRIPTENLKYPFVILDGFPPFSDFLQQGFQYSRWEDDDASEDSAALWM